MLWLKKLGILWLDFGYFNKTISFQLILAAIIWEPFFKSFIQFIVISLILDISTELFLT